MQNKVCNGKNDYFLFWVFSPYNNSYGSDRRIDRCVIVNEPKLVVLYDNETVSTPRYSDLVIKTRKQAFEITK